MTDAVPQPLIDALADGRLEDALKDAIRTVIEEIYGRSDQSAPVFSDPDSRYPDGTKVRVTFEGYVRNMTQHPCNVRYVVYPTPELDWTKPTAAMGVIPLLTPQRQQWARVTKLEDPPVAEGSNDSEDQ